MLRCYKCNRCLKKAAAYVGPLPLGPTCARKMGKIKPRRSATRQENDQLDLFAESEKP